MVNRTHRALSRPMLPGVDDGITVVSTDLDTSVSWAYFTEET